MLLTPVRAILFDVGNVLVSDAPTECEFYRLLFHECQLVNRSLSMTRFMAEREQRRQTQTETEYLTTYVGGVLGASFEQVAHECWLKVRANWCTIASPIPGAVGVLQALSQVYRLGIVANQPPECLPLLRSSGLFSLFELVGIDSLVGLSKPDPAFFQWACASLNLSPSEILYVGDRLDNDIVPALNMGMHAVWVYPRVGSYTPMTTRWEAVFFASQRRILARDRQKAREAHTALAAWKVTSVAVLAKRLLSPTL